MNPLATDTEKTNVDYHIRRRKQKAPKDWIKITALVAAVLGGLLIALAMVSFQGMLPTDLLPTPVAKITTLLAGGSIAAPAGYVLFHRWRNPLSA